MGLAGTQPVKSTLNLCAARKECPLSQAGRSSSSSLKSMWETGEAGQNGPVPRGQPIPISLEINYRRSQRGGRAAASLGIPCITPRGALEPLTPLRPSTTVVWGRKGCVTWLWPRDTAPPGWECSGTVGGLGAGQRRGRGASLIQGSLG